MGICQYPMHMGGCDAQSTTPIYHEVTEEGDEVRRILLGHLCGKHAWKLILPKETVTPKEHTRITNVPVEETNEQHVHTRPGVLRKGAKLAQAGEGNPAGLAG